MIERLALVLLIVILILAAVWLGILAIATHWQQWHDPLIEDLITLNTAKPIHSGYDPKLRERTAKKRRRAAKASQRAARIVSAPVPKKKPAADHVVPMRRRANG